jgi:dienelactone hydrolase
MSSRHVWFENEGERLCGVVTVPEGGRSDVAVVVLHGWAGYRIGPHQMLTKTTRQLAESGFASLRFDFRGRGDSEGPPGEANLATMIADTEAAVDFVAQELDTDHVALLGICSGGEVAIGAGVQRELIDAMALWSVPIVAAEPGRQRPKSRTWHHLKEYGRKLLRPETWRKIVTGNVRTDMVKKALVDGGAYETPEDNVKLGIDWHERFTTFPGPILFIYGGNDPATEKSIAHYRDLCAAGGVKSDFHVVEGANHAFYSLAWEREVIAKTAEWLGERYARPGGANGARAA